MMRGLIVAVLCSGCAGATVSRSVMSGLPPLPTAQVSPDEWLAAFAGSQISPAHQLRTDTDTGVQVSAAQPEAGMLFLTAGKWLLVGASLYGAYSEWVRPSTPRQIDIKDSFMFGARSRIAFRGHFHPNAGVIVSLEPGLELLPMAEVVAGRIAFTSLHMLPTLGGSLVPYYETSRLRLFAGASASTMPAITATGVVTAGCGGASCSGGALGVTFRVAVQAGIKVNLPEGFALSATATVPIDTVLPNLLPMVALALSYQRAQPVPDPPEPQPAPLPPPPPAWPVEQPEAPLPPPTL
ncbi:MAG: hypothetical protein JNK82_19600 [Myxococcaceae bacterium]|nr:hypothetical protein [Myxococcaceae bacterium]